MRGREWRDNWAFVVWSRGGKAWYGTYELADLGLGTGLLLTG
jgi:hypothetical protein